MSFNSLSISKKLHIPLIASIAIGFLIVIGNYFYSIKNIRQNVYANEAASFQKTYESLINEKKSVGLTNAITLSENYYIIKGLVDNNRTIAINGLHGFSNYFKGYTHFKNIKVHIHDATMHSFLRI